MPFRRRRRAPRLIALVAAFAVQAWSVAPVAASVVYCIGADGHSGFEFVGAGVRGCGDCCHDESRGEAFVREGAVSECTDVALTSATVVPGKSSTLSGRAPAGHPLPPDVRPPLRWSPHSRGNATGPPSTLSQRRSIVLLI